MPTDMREAKVANIQSGNYCQVRGKARVGTSQVLMKCAVLLSITIKRVMVKCDRV
jgi:hypothetical protein